LLLITGLALSCTKITLLQNSLNGNTPEVQVVHSELVTTVLKVLGQSHRSGSLVFRGQCTNAGGMSDSFKVASPGQNVNPIQSLHAAFLNDSTLALKEDSSGMIRVVGGAIRPELLNITVHNLRLEEGNDPRAATYKVLAAPEVKAYMQSHDIQFVTTSGGLIPPPSGRHLSDRLTDVTVSESLDRIAVRRVRNRPRKKASGG